MHIEEDIQCGGGLVAAHRAILGTDTALYRASKIMVALTHCELLLEIQQILKASRRASPWAPQVCLRCCRADQDGVTIAIYVSK